MFLQFKEKIKTVFYYINSFGTETQSQIGGKVGYIYICKPEVKETMPHIFNLT